MAYPTTLSQFINTMFYILSQPTGYYNRYPFNLGYWHDQNDTEMQNCFSFDCVNLLKSVLCGWHDDRTLSPYAFPDDPLLIQYNYFQSDLTRTGDVNEWGFITECRGLSTDFTNMTACSALYMGGHIGCFMGGEFTRGGLIYNTIECTSGSVVGDGVVASYVDANGGRYDHKGGTYAGQWTHNALLTGWLDYDTQFVDPGRDTDPINPGGGSVTPPDWQNPNLREKKKYKWWMYMKPYYKM